MPDVQAFLSRKAGPLPVWGWAALGGGLVAVLYLRGKGQTPATPTGAQNTDASGQGLFAPSPIVVTPSTMPVQTGSMNPAPPTGGGLRVGAGGTTVWGGHPYRWVVTGPGQGPQDAAQALNLGGSISDQIGRLVYFTPSPQSDGQGATIWYVGLTDGGQPLPAWGSAPWPPPYGGVVPAAAGQLVGMGGGVLSTLPGAGHVGRFTSPHVHPQFVNVGMGGGGRAGLKAMAKRTGVPEARLMALNPGHWRPTPGGRPRHIHMR